MPNKISWCCHYYYYHNLFTMLIIVCECNATASICDELQRQPGSSRPSKAAALGVQLTDSDQLSPRPSAPSQLQKAGLWGKPWGRGRSWGRKEQRGVCEGVCGTGLCLSQPVTHQNPSQREQLAPRSPPQCSLSSHRAPPPLSPASQRQPERTHSQPHRHTHMLTCAPFSLLLPAPTASIRAN